MEDYIQNIAELSVSRSRRMTPDEHVSDAELHNYQSLAGSLLHFGHAVLPEPYIVASKMQQKLGWLKVAHYVDAIVMLRKLRSFKPVVSFKKPRSIWNTQDTPLSEASYTNHDAS